MHDDGASAPHPSLLEAVRDLTAEQARRRPAGGGPSIQDLVRAGLDRKRAVLWAWDHDEAHPDGVAGGPSAGASGHGSDDASWDRDLNELRRLARGVQERLAAADDRLLDRDIDGLGGSVAHSALDLAGHDAFLAGQVQALRRYVLADAGPDD